MKKPRHLTYRLALKHYRKYKRRLSRMLDLNDVNFDQSKKAQFLLKRIDELKSFLSIRANAAKTMAVGSAFALTLMANVGQAQCSFKEQFGINNPLEGLISYYDYSSTEFVDIDNDGDLDVFLGQSNWGYGMDILYFENTGTSTNPNYQPAASPITANDFQAWTQPRFVDIDNDGDLDFFTGDNSGLIRFFENTGNVSTPSFSEVIGASNPFDGVMPGSFTNIDFADMDNDGDFDVFLGSNYNSGAVLYFENTGTASSATFTQQFGTNNPMDGFNTNYLSNIAIADIDNDGDFDIMISGGSYSGQIHYFENSGDQYTPVFGVETNQNILFPGASFGNYDHISLGDIDGDGDLDFSVGVGANNPTRYFENKTDVAINVLPECSGSTSTATAVGSYPSSDYTYVWSTGSTTNMATGLTNGVYKTTVTSNGGCADVISVTVTGTAVSSISVTNVINPISACTTNPKPTKLVYNWLSTDCSGNEPIEFFINASSVYGGVIDQQNSCTCSPMNDQSITITDPSKLSLLNNGNNNFEVQYFGTNSYISYAQVTIYYSDMSSQNIIMLLPQNGNIGDYGFELCTYGYVNSSSSNVDESIAISTDGAVDITVNGGVPPYIFDWSNDGVGDFDDAEDLTTTVTGTYFVTVEDNCGQTYQSSGYTINQMSLNPLSVILNNLNDVSCVGQSDGAISVAANDACGPLSYTWVGPGSYTSSSPNIYGLSGGVYNLTVTDDDDLVVKSYTITEPAPLNITISTVTASCVGGDGEAHALGGSSTYSYDWYDNNWNYLTSGTDLYGQSATGVILQVYDGMSCFYEFYGTIPQADQITISITDVMEGCTGGDGELTATATGGLGGGFSYYWYDSGSNYINSTTSITGLYGGDYSVEVYDGGGCYSSTSVTLNSKKITSTPYQNNVTCNGNADGYAQVNVSGGSWNYLYNWNNGGTDSYISGLSGGNFVITVQDATYGCITITSFNINEPEALDLSFSIFEPTCNGYSDGAVYATISGGTTPYAYSSWGSINSSNVTSISGISAGTYQLEVYDNNWNCYYTENVTVSEPTNVTVTASILDETCGEMNGQIVASALGGTPNYSFKIDGNNGNTLSNLDGGVYAVEVYDSYMCYDYTLVTITNTEPINLTTNVLSDASCGSSDGSADVSVTGGTSPYSYLWNTGQNTNTLTGVAAGTYIVTVYGTDLCEATESIGISNVGAPTVTLAVTSVTCNAGNDGSASVTVTAVGGGVTSTSYVWSNNVFMPTNTGLSAGTYYVTVEDNNGCATVKRADIYEPNAISFSITATDVTCFGNSDGNAGIFNIMGGSGVYASYDWSSSEITTSISNKAAGSYSITVTDNLGCTGENSIVIDEPVALSITLAGTPTACIGGSNGSITASVSGGTSPYFYNWDDVANTMSATVTGIYGGVDYTVTVYDVNSCMIIESMSVTEQNGFTATTSSTAETACGSSDGSASVSVNGGTAPFDYNWINGDNTSTSTGLNTGVYGVTVTDSDGCYVYQSAIVTNAAGPQVTTNAYGVSCNGDSDGEITATIAGATTATTYLWNNGATTSTITGLMPGTYLITVSNGGCADGYASADITNPDVLSVAMTSTAETAIGLNNGTATAMPVGGTSPYSYTWTGSAGTGSTISNLTPGSYTSFITDNHGCTTQGSVTVAAGTTACSISVSVTTNSVSCNGSTDGSAEANVSGGTLPLTYNWNNGGNTAIISNLAPGSYKVTVTDKNQCKATSANATVVEPVVLAVSVYGTDATTPGGTDGSAIAYVTGGTSPYTYSWSNSFTGVFATGLTPGVYTVDVTDLNMCTTSASVTISAPSGIDEIASIDMEVYPNPNDGDFIFKVSANGKYTLNITNVIGQVITTETLNVTGYLTKEYHLQGVESGIYYVTLVGDKGTRTKKIIVK